MTIADRAEAGRRLAIALDHLRGEDCVVVALPRGGVEVAFPVAQSLQAPLTLMLIRKIGVPSQPELAMGAIVDGEKPIVVRNDDVIRHGRIPASVFDATAKRELEELERRHALYLGGRPEVPIAGRIAVIVDDGIATGATVRAAIAGLWRRNPRKLVLAVPVAADDTLDMLKPEVDELVCLEPLSPFGAISISYRHFPQLTDNEVIALLDAAGSRPGQAGSENG